MNKLCAKLKRNFVLITVLSVLAVLILLTAIVFSVTTHTTIYNTRQMLQNIARCDGDLSRMDAIPAPYLFDKSLPYFFKYFGHNSTDSDFSAETKYKYRFFIVYTVNEKDETDYTYNMEHIASITTIKAVEYTQKALSSSKTSGFVKNYMYLKVPTENGVKIVFYDFSNYFYNIISITENLLLGIAIVLVAVFLISMFLSSIAIKPFEEAIKKQKRFVTDASHELKTPISIISANSEVLRLECPDSKWLDSIDRQTKRMNNLVSKLVELAKYDEKDGEIIFCEFNLSEAVLDTTAEFEPAAKAEGVKINFNVAPDITYKGDEGAIRQLISILCDNAIKYSAGQKQIHISLLKKNSSIHLDIDNSCENISDAQLEHVFDRFYRSDEARTQSNGSSYGIGLSIAESIVLSHKGKIFAKSIDNGSGVRITVIFV